MVCTSGTPQRSRGERADLAGEPVVGVDEVVVAPRLVRASVRSTSRAKAHSWPGQLALAQPLERAGVDVAHA